MGAILIQTTTVTSKTFFVLKYSNILCQCLATYRTVLKLIVEQMHLRTEVLGLDHLIVTSASSPTCWPKFEYKLSPIGSCFQMHGPWLGVRGEEVGT